MFHWFSTVTNTRGDALPGWQIECVQETDGQTVVPIFADANGTPIISVSGVANRAVADQNGNYFFFVPSGTYSLRFYNPSGVFQLLQQFITMYGDVDNETAANAAAAQAARDVAVAAADVASNLGNAPIYGALADLPTADGSQGWAVIPFGPDEGIYEDVAGTWTRQADTQVLRAQAWAEGTEPGGPGTKSAKEHADDAQTFAQGISPFAQATLTGNAISPSATFTVTRPIVNGLAFVRFHGRVIGGSGSVVINVFVGGSLVHGPVTVDAAGRTDVISVTADPGDDIEFGVQSVAGNPTAVLLVLEGA
jgi:hypothetical protein